MNSLPAALPRAQCLILLLLRPYSPLTRAPLSPGESQPCPRAPGVLGELGLLLSPAQGQEGQEGQEAPEPDPGSPAG